MATKLILRNKYDILIVSILHVFQIARNKILKPLTKRLLLPVFWKKALFITYVCWISFIYLTFLSKVGIIDEKKETMPERIRMRDFNG